jgi:hypothetical protein
MRSLMALAAFLIMLAGLFWLVFFCLGRPFQP